MKKVILLILLFTLTFSLTGCYNDPDIDPDTGECIYEFDGECYELVGEYYDIDHIQYGTGHSGDYIAFNYMLDGVGRVGIINRNFLDKYIIRIDSDEYKLLFFKGPKENVYRVEIYYPFCEYDGGSCNE